MSDIGKIIGRQREIALLQEIYESPKAEFVAVYGRRRIGKTYLIDKIFEDKYDFYMTGIYEGTRKEQLTNFAQVHRSLLCTQSGTETVIEEYHQQGFVLA